VHDWSTRHIVFVGLTPENIVDAMDADPRAWHSWANRARHHFEPRPDPKPFPFHRSRRHHKRLTTDWQMPIGIGVGPHAYAASSASM
jgi:hypothetical protein